MKHILNIILLLLAGLIHAQQDTPEQAVDAYLQYYEDGDTTGLKTVFHPEFILTYISPWEKGAAAFKKVDRKGLFRFFNDRWSELDISGYHDKIEVQGNIAHTRAVVRLEGIVEWTDYITMIQIDGKWWIISKSSTGKLLKKRD